MLLLLLQSMLCVLVTVNAAVGQDLITNGDFESPLSQAWSCLNCSIQRVSSDSHGGHSALKVTSRSHTNHGPSQLVHVKSGTRYRVQAYVKQLNDGSTLFQHHSLRLTVHWAGDSKSQAIKVSYHSPTRSVDGWFSLIGYFILPNRAISSGTLHHLGPDGGIDYLIDDVSLTELAEDTNWESEANARIENIRKGDIDIRFRLPDSISPADVSVQVDHKKHLFGFGSLVKDEYILDPLYKGYQDIVYSLFNLATLQSFKWKFDKGTREHPDYTQALAAMRTLNAHGVDVRGHNLFWGLTKNLPDWVPSLSLPQLNASIENRLHYMINATKGQLLQWDVVNELMHGQWFQEKFQDPNFSQNIFRQVKALDPHPTLMLNDFHIAAEPDGTDDYLQQAKRFLAQGVPLEALGLQSHFKDMEPLDPTIIKLRLDHISKSGLPLWITEMNLVEKDPVERANMYEKVYRLYFSYPQVRGIVLWGFSDQQAKSPMAALFDGLRYTINEAGRRVANLILKEWSTHVNQTLTSGSTNVNVRGFKGDYDVTVRVRGVPVKVQSFSLTGDSATVDISLTGNEGSVTLPSPQPTLAGLFTGPGATDSPSGDHVLGHASSTTTFSTLSCTARWSPVSSPGNNQHTQVACLNGEVLTGCSSVLQNHDWRREGEKIEVQFGQPICMALDGYRSTQGVQAVAVCCKARDLTCTYRAAGPSPSGHDTTVGSACDNSQHALGCSAWNFHSQVGGVATTSTSCLAHNQDTHGGVYVYSACCGAPQLSCHTVTSSPSGRRKGDVTQVRCDAGYIMTSCNALSSHGKSSGAFMTGTVNSECKAYNGAHIDQGQPGVKAVATCCRLGQGLTGDAGVIGR